MDIKYNIIDEFDHIFDEKGNTFLALRKISWGDEPNPDKAKYDIRKWYTSADGTESVGKGVSFITEQGPHNLARVLVENNFGNTRELLNGMKDREDFRSSLNIVLGKDSEFYDEAIPEQLYVPNNNLFDYEE